MHSSTARTVPLADIKGHFPHNIPAVGASFRTGEPSVNLEKSTTVPLALVLQLSDQLSPRAIVNSKGQLVILDQILHCQILNRNRLVLADQLSGELVKKIFSRISNFLMHFSHFESRFLSIERAFLFATQSFAALLSWARLALNPLGLVTFVPSLRATKLVIPKSTPISLEDFGNGSISMFANRETVHLPAGESLTVTVDGVAPFGS